MSIISKYCFSGLLILNLFQVSFLQAADPKKTASPLPEIIPETAMPAPKLPELTEVMNITREYFAQWKGYEPGDLLTRNKVKPLFRDLQKAGWKVKEEPQLLKRMHSDSGFLASQLHTPKGIRFMRRIAKMPGGYDRLDHLLAMPYGKRRIKEFINSPGGYTMIEYMTTTKGGKNLGKYLSQTRTGKGFNKPTDMIYTETQLLQVLKQAYEKEVALRKRQK